MSRKQHGMLDFWGVPRSRGTGSMTEYRGNRGNEGNDPDDDDWGGLILIAIICVVAVGFLVFFYHWHF